MFTGDKMKMIVLLILMFPGIVLGNIKWNSIGTGERHLLTQNIQFSDEFAMQEGSDFLLLKKEAMPEMGFSIYSFKMQSCTSRGYQGEMDLFTFQIEQSVQEIAIEVEKGCMIIFYISTDDETKKSLLK